VARENAVLAIFLSVLGLDIVTGIINIGALLWKKVADGKKASEREDEEEMQPQIN